MLESPGSRTLVHATALLAKARKELRAEGIHGAAKQVDAALRRLRRARLELSRPALPADQPRPLEPPPQERVVYLDEGEELPAQPHHPAKERRSARRARRLSPDPASPGENRDPSSNPPGLAAGAEARPTWVGPEGRWKTRLRQTLSHYVCGPNRIERAVREAARRTAPFRGFDATAPAASRERMLWRARARIAVRSCQRAPRDRSEPRT